MAMPSANSPVWTDIISGKKKVEFDFLAVRIFLGSAQLNYKNNPSSLQQSATDLFKLIEKNQNLPAVQKDIQKL